MTAVGAVKSRPIVSILGRNESLSVIVSGIEIVSLLIIQLMMLMLLMMNSFAIIVRCFLNAIVLVKAIYFRLLVNVLQQRFAAAAVRHIISRLHQVLAEQRGERGSGNGAGRDGC